MLTKLLHLASRSSVWTASPTPFPLGYVAVALRPVKSQAAIRHEAGSAGP